MCIRDRSNPVGVEHLKKSYYGWIFLEEEECFSQGRNSSRKEVTSVITEVDDEEEAQAGTGLLQAAAAKMEVDFLQEAGLWVGCSAVGI